MTTIQNINLASIAEIEHAAKHSHNFEQLRDLEEQIKQIQRADIFRAAKFACDRRRSALIFLASIRRLLLSATTHENFGEGLTAIWGMQKTGFISSQDADRLECYDEEVRAHRFKLWDATPMGKAFKRMDSPRAMLLAVDQDAQTTISNERAKQ